jgi:RimJ/RimL family protein N-acetyltransferase
MVRAERLSSAHEAAALEYLARSPYENVFLSYLILFDVASATRRSIYVALDASGGVCGAAYFGKQVVIAARDEETIGAFATLGERHRGERMIVGPRAAIESYWRRVGARHAPPRVVRERQLVMKIDRTMLRPYEHDVLVRHARIDEWPSVADNSASMIAQELDYDPRRSSPEFTANVRAMIERHLWWVGESYGRLCFFLNIGPWSSQTAQLQGIWTPPDLRGRGLATSALAGICDKLLGMSPTLSLYVNDFNTPAIALYERVGFETVAEYQTLLF